MEHGGQTRVPALRHARRDRRGVALGRIEIDVEVRGPQHVKVEALVLDLVAAEVLGRRGGHNRQLKNAGENLGHSPGAGARQIHRCCGFIDPRSNLHTGVIYSLGLGAAVTRHTGGRKADIPAGCGDIWSWNGPWIWVIRRRIGAWTGQSSQLSRW